METQAHALTSRAAEIDTPTRAAIPVAGIGASAGGLEVFKRLLGLLPVDTGFAIVFVQHLDPNHRSMLAEILARATSMRVSEAADGMAVEANQVYVIPANVNLTTLWRRAESEPSYASARVAHAHRSVFSIVGCRLRKPGNWGHPVRHRFRRLRGRGRHQSCGWRDVRAGRGHGKIRHHAASGGGHRLRGFRPSARGHCRRT